MMWKSLPLHDLEGQYCNRNCIVYATSSLTRHSYCEKNFWNLHPIFLLVIYDCSCLYRLVRRHHFTTCNACYTSVNCSFWEQHSVNIACVELCNLWEITFSPWLEVRCWSSDVGSAVWLFLAIAGLLVMFQTAESYRVHGVISAQAQGPVRVRLLCCVISESIFHGIYILLHPVYSVNVIICTSRW